MSRPVPEEWSQLLNAFADESLTRRQEQRLTELLRTDAKFRTEYVRFMQLLTALVWQSGDLPAVISRDDRPNSDVAVPVRHRRIRRTIPVAALAAASALVLAIGLSWWGMQRPSDDSLGRLTSLTGQVRIAGAGGSEQKIRSADLAGRPWTVRPGDRLQTEMASSVTLTLKDGTELLLHAASQAAFDNNGRHRVRLGEGRLTARVRPQPAESAFIINTPQAGVRVLGTELDVLAMKTLTNVLVSKGRVRVTRIADGAEVEVAPSQLVSVAAGGTLAVIDVPDLPETWSENFEHGLPAGWTGRQIHQELPDGSRGAVAPIRFGAPGDAVGEIRSPWNESGLFAWHTDSVLQLSFRLQPPEWFHVYLLARPIGNPDSLLTYCCVKPEIWQTAPGRWRTMAIPLSDFHVVTYGRDEPALGVVPVQIALVGSAGPTQLFVDRIAVQRRVEE